MEIKTLGELCNIVSGGTPLRSKQEYWNNGTIPWIKIGDMKGKYINSADECITQAGLDSSSAKMLPKGTILYTIFATLGEVGILEINASTNQAIAGLTIKDNSQILSEYLYYYLKSKKGYVKTIGRGVAQSNINMSILKSFQVPLPTSLKQKEIVDILDKITNIIKYRQQELQMLENLIKARFVEMFGLVRNNVYGYKIKMLQDVCEPIKDGTHQTPTYVNDAQHGFKFLSSKDVTSGKINWSKIKYIPSDLHEELYAKIKPKRGDILLAKNGTTGVAAVVETDEIFDIYVSLALLRPIDMNSIYLWAAVNSADTKHQFDSSLKGIGVPNLHLGDIKKTKIIVPPLELQSQFADFVTQIDKSKATVQKALDETQLLFDSLMQKYFG